MNPIDTYLDTAFSSLPATHEAIEARNDIRILMLDKHEELTSQGMDEQEAYEKVVADFGDISEVAYALGLGEFVDGTNPIDNKAVRLDEPRAKAYVKHRASRGRKIGLGVGLLGLWFGIWSAVTTYYNLAHNLPYENADYPPMMNWITFGIFALALGVALYLFLSNPYKTEKHFVTNMPLALTRKTKESIVAQREERKGMQKVRLILGIIFIAISQIVTIPLSGHLSVSNSNGIVVEANPLYGDFSPLVTGALDFFAAIMLFLGIYLLIIRGVERNAYKALLK